MFLIFCDFSCLLSELYRDKWDIKRVIIVTLSGRLLSDDWILPFMVTRSLNGGCCRHFLLAVTHRWQQWPPVGLMLSHWIYDSAEEVLCFTLRGNPSLGALQPSRVHLLQMYRRAVSDIRPSLQASCGTRPLGTLQLVSASDTWFLAEWTDSCWSTRRQVVCTFVDKAWGRLQRASTHWTVPRPFSFFFSFSNSQRVLSHATQNECVWL